MATRDEKHQTLAAACPGRQAAEIKRVTLRASTGKADKKVTEDFEADLPASLADAIAIEGADDVFKRYLSSRVIELQGDQRNKMAPEGEKKERKRAGYLDELGI